MKHAGDDAVLFFAIVETAMIKVMVTAKKRGLCPNCMLEAMAAFCVTNQLIQSGVVKDGKVMRDPTALFDSLTEVAMQMALVCDGEDWEPGDTETRH